jgi:hypothetical protein
MTYCRNIYQEAEAAWVVIGSLHLPLHATHPLPIIYAFAFPASFALRLILDTILYHVNMKYYTQLNSEERQHSNGSLFVLANIFEAPFNNS